MHSETKTRNKITKGKKIKLQGKSKLMKWLFRTHSHLTLSKQGQPWSVYVRQGTGHDSGHVDTAKMERSSTQRSRPYAYGMTAHMDSLLKETGAFLSRQDP